jgi:hypothetical protein
MNKSDKAFLASVRRHFGEICRIHNMVETALSERHIWFGNGALGVSVTTRDPWGGAASVKASVDRLLVGSLRVQDLVWLATGKRAATTLLGQARSSSEQDIDAAVAGLATALATYGNDVLSDAAEWERTRKHIATAEAILSSTARRLGEAFLGSVRERFSELFEKYGFVETETFLAVDFAWCMSQNDQVFMRAHCAFEDRLVTVTMGLLVRSRLPPDLWEEPSKVADVRRVPMTVIAWLATGDRDTSLRLGSYAEDSEEAIDAAVAELADALDRDNGRLLAGDPAVWRRAAELEMVRRTLG